MSNDETPGGGPLDGDEYGAIFQYRIGTTTSDALFFQSYGSFSTAHDQVYAHAKVGYNTGNLRFGPEFTYFEDDTSDGVRRVGLFL